MPRDSLVSPWKTGKQLMSTKSLWAFQCPPFSPEPPGITLKTRKAHRGKLIQTIYVLTGPNWDEVTGKPGPSETWAPWVGTELGGAHQSRINGAAHSTLCFHPSSWQSQWPGQKWSFVTELGKACSLVPEARIRRPFLWCEPQMVKGWLLSSYSISHLKWEVTPQPVTLPGTGPSENAISLRKDKGARYNYK